MSDTTDLIPIESSSGEVVAEIPREPLTKEEDDFAFAFVEYGGNLRRAWAFASGNENPRSLVVPRNMLKQVNVALRIKELQEVGEEHMIITKSSHLLQLAEIRDIALARGETKVALQSEVARGEVAGLYIKHAKNTSAPQAVTVVINNKNDLSI